MWSVRRIGVCVLLSMALGLSVCALAASEPGQTVTGDGDGRTLVVTGQPKPSMAEICREERRGAQSQGLQLTAEVENDTLAVAHELKLRLKLTNCTSETLCVVDTCPRYDDKLSVTDSVKGEVAIRDDFIESVYRCTTIELKPGETVTDERLVSDTHDISAPGAYEITAARSVHRLDGEGFDYVVSNAVTVTVVDSGVVRLGLVSAGPSEPIDSFHGAKADCYVMTQETLSGAGGTLSLPAPDRGNVDVPVEVRRSRCRVVAYELNPNCESSSAILYEVRSTDPNVDFCWRMWSVLNWGRIHVIHSGDGDYLAGVALDGVRFVRIGEPVSRAEALDASVSGGLRWFTGVVVPATRLVPEVRDWGVNAMYYDIDVTSLNKDAEGNWVVCIANPDRTKQYTLVRDKSAQFGWRVQR